MTKMDDCTIQRLNALNCAFYQTFSESFSLTRAAVQPGVKKALAKFSPKRTILDIGCGNGNLMLVLEESKFAGYYVGIDFSENLVQASQGTFQKLKGQVSFQAEFAIFDLINSNWHAFPFQREWDVICSFAVFHHIAGQKMRMSIFQHIHDLLSPESLFIFSVWQPQNSWRLRERFVEWNIVDIDEDSVEKGDVLLDWKAEKIPQQRIGYRYVHIFDQNELEYLADKTDFTLLESFYSDGKEGNVALYQIWKKR